jgi:hypothetical protein
MPNSLANVEKLAIDGNDLDQAGIDPLVEALNTSALPRLRTVFGVGGAAHGTEVPRVGTDEGDELRYGNTRDIVGWKGSGNEGS